MAVPTSSTFWSRAVLDRTRDSVALYERDGRVVYINPVTERLFGASLDALEGRVLWELFPEGKRTRFYEAFQEVARTGEAATFDNYYPPWDRWFENEVFLVGEQVCVIGADVTEARRVRARAEALQAITAALGRALTREEVADAVLEHVVAACGATKAGLSERVGDELHGLSYTGFPEDVTARFKRFPYDAASAARECLEGREPLFFSSLEAYALAYPPEAALAREAGGTGARAVLPLIAGERAVGLLWLTWDAPREVDEAERAFFASVARQCGQALERARLVTSLREEKERFRSLAESVPQVAWIARPDGALEYLNPRWTSLTGLSLEESLGTGWLAGLHPEDRELVMRRWREAVERGHDFEVECRHLRKEGGYRWMLARAAPFGDGRERWFGTSTDITDRKRREKGLDVLASASAALASFDDLEPLLERVAWVVARRFARWACVHVCEGDVLRLAAVDHVDLQTARAFQEGAEPVPLFGPDPLAALVRDGLPRLYPSLGDDAPDPAAPRALFEAMGARSAVVVPLLSRRRPLGVLSFGTLSDEERLDTEDVEIGVEVAYRAASAVEAVRLYELAREEQRRAVEASRLKDEFLATLSHELRTPLSAITGWVDLLRRGILSEEKQARAALVIDRNARTLARLIDDILDVSRIVAGKLRLKVEPVSLAEVVEAAVDTVRPTAAAKGVALEADLAAGAGAVLGDAGRLTQVTWNLLVNALKFTPQGGRVRVSLAARGGLFELVVEDTGQGIPPAFLPHLFERFRQADASSTRQHGGLGLGLALVKHIVELHGGSVEAESEGEGRGARFTVRLPKAVAGADAATEAEVPAPPPAGARASRALAGLRVLVVDDDAETREVVASLLEAAAAEVVTAASAGEALAALERARPDVLLSDIAMPGEDGVSLLGRVRDLPRQRGGATPAIALTAFASPEERARLLDAGFCAHVPKPVAPDALLDAIARAARREEPATTSG